MGVLELLDICPVKIIKSNAQNCFKMKNLIVVLFLTGFVLHLQAQETQNSKLGLYKCTKLVFMEFVNSTGVPDSIITVSNEKKPKDRALSSPNAKFNVIEIKNGYAIIKFLDFTVARKDLTKDDSTLIKKFPDSIKLITPVSKFYIYNFTGSPNDYTNISNIDANTSKYGDKQAYFRMSVDMLDICAVRDERESYSMAFGVINFPFKYRFQKDRSDFSGAFNFGAAIGAKFPSRPSCIWKQSALMGFSISNTVIDSVAADKHQDKLSSTNNFTAFSLSIGYLLEYKGVQLGIFLGFDKLSRINQEEFGWHYQGKPWLSIGLGYSIFSTKSSSDVNQPKQNSD